MPILTRQPEADEPAMSHHIADVRRGGEPTIGAGAPPPEDLLPSGGSHHRAGPAHGVGPARGCTAPRWAEAAFQRRVEVVRRQLAPVCSRAALAASYGREAGHRMTSCRSSRIGPVTPLQVAYALRWMELARPAPALVTWTDLLDGPADGPRA